MADDPMFLELSAFKDQEEKRNVSAQNATSLMFTLKSGQVIKEGSVSRFNDTNSVVEIHTSDGQFYSRKNHLIRISEIAMISAEFD